MTVLRIPFIKGYGLKDAFIAYLGDDSIDLILLDGHEDTSDEGRRRILKKMRNTFRVL